MNYAVKDPRERLVEVGNALLDVMFKMHQWDQRYPEVQKMLDAKKQNGEMPEAEVNAFVHRDDFLEAFMSRFQLSSEYEAAQREYTTLRATIEALEAPRPQMPGDPS